jgi:hypothetical protein
MMMNDYFERVKQQRNWVPLAIAGAGLVANYFANKEANAANVSMQQDANAMNYRIAKEQMGFQADMSNTAHQREVDDLRKAGLNPNLSAGGNGSSTPSGASATMQAAQVRAPEIAPSSLQIASLLQDQERIKLEKQSLDTQKAESAARIAKGLTDQELTKMKTILAQKGIVKAELEGEAAEVLQRMIDFLKRKMHYNSPKKPKININPPR